MTASSGRARSPGAAARALSGQRLERPVPTAQRVADVLRGQISDGVLPPGVQLVEESVAEALGVSRNTVREGFALLAGERIVDRVPARGVFVATPGADDVRDLYRARMAVEAAAVCWGRAPDEGVLEEMRACIVRARECEVGADWDGVALANQTFHRAIASLTGSERTVAWFATLLAQLRLVFQQIEDHSFHAVYIQDNARVLAALEDSDRDAAHRVLVDYLDRARDDVIERLTA